MAKAIGRSDEFEMALRVAMEHHDNEDEVIPQVIAICMSVKWINRQLCTSRCSSVHVFLSQEKPRTPGMKWHVGMVMKHVL